MIKKINFKNKIFRKKELKQLVYEAFINYGIIRSSLLADDIKNLGFNYATKAGLSISIEDLKIPPTKKELLSSGNKEILNSDLAYTQGKINNVERFQNILNTWNQISEILKSNLITFFENSDPLNSIYLMAFSGARGNLSQIRQLVGMRGLMADPNGKIIDIPIIHNFREGLSITDYLISSYGARKGVVDTALRTADSGYLTRRLIDVAQCVIIREYNCETKRSIKISKTQDNELFVKKIVGRTIAETLYTKKFGTILISKNELINKKISSKILLSNVSNVKVYSPLTCESSRSICQTCYGWDLANSKIIGLGEAIGIIAAQSIGEPGTQLTMRTFHTGGIFTSDLSRQIISKVNGLLCYDPEIKVKLIRTLYGVYINSIERDAIFSIIDYYNAKNNIKLFADSLIFIKDKSFIKKGTLIAELMNKSHQKISSKKDIIATHSGEILFSLEKNIIWILEGNVYNLPRNSFFNKFNLNKIINFQDNLFSSKIINKAQGIITIKKGSFSTQQNSIQISNCLESFNHYPIFWEKKKKKLIIFFQNNGKKKLYQLELLSPNKEKKGIFFAQHLTNKYKTHTPGKIVLLDNNFNKKNNYKNKIIRKNEKILFLPIEIFTINKDKRFVFIKNNTKLKQIGTELISGVFSKTDGFTQIKESNQIINEIEIKPGDYFEYLKVTKSQISELKKINKKIYFPGEIIFEHILIRYLTIVEIIKIKNSHSILLRPIEEFNIPKSKDQKKIPFKIINKLKFDKEINEEVKIPLNLIDNQIWYENANYTSVSFIYKLLKAEKFLENNSFLKKFYFQNKINLTKKELGVYRHKFNQEKGEIFYFSILDEEKFKINLFLPKKLDNEKLKISFFIKELEYIERNTLIGKISIIPNTNSTLIQLRSELHENLKILLITRDNYKIYYNEIYPSFRTKKKFVLVNNKVGPLMKTKLSGKIELLKPFKFNVHKSTPFFITHSTKLYIRTGNFIKKDEILGIIIYEQIVTGDIVQGLPKIEEILEARKTKSSALLSNIPGIIKKIETMSYDNNLTMIQLFGNTNIKNYRKFFRIRLTGIEKKIFIKKDQFIHLGQALTDGFVNSHNLLITYFSFYLNFTNEFEAAYLSFKNIQFLLIEKVQEVYITQGVVISNKHLEVILKQMTSKIQILRSSDTFLLPNEILELKQINYINEILKKSGRKKVLFQPILLGITKASLLSDSFISASSFQETTKILTSAAIEGKIDWLRGLKENVIIGNIVPIGTGFEK